MVGSNAFIGSGAWSWGTHKDIYNGEGSLERIPQVCLPDETRPYVWLSVATEVERQRELTKWFRQRTTTKNWRPAYACHLNCNSAPKVNRSVNAKIAVIRNASWAVDQCCRERDANCITAQGRTFQPTSLVNSLMTRDCRNAITQGHRQKEYWIALATLIASKIRTKTWRYSVLVSNRYQTDFYYRIYRLSDNSQVTHEQVAKHVSKWASRLQVYMNLQQL